MIIIDHSHYQENYQELHVIYMYASLITSLFIYQNKSHMFTSIQFLYVSICIINS